MTVETYLMKVNGKEIRFSRPYLNDNKELTFLHCDAFSRFPSTQFVLSEQNQAIELREPTSKKKVFLLLKGNEHLLEQAKKKKEYILDLLRGYTNRLKTGKEKVIVFGTGIQQHPYYFTTESIIEYGEISCKFVTGFMYFINMKLKEAGVNIQFDDYTEMQKRLAEHFKGAGLNKFQTEKIGNQEAKTISFDQFVQLLV